MGFRVREIDKESKFCDQLTVSAMARVLPKETIEAVLHDLGAVTPRHRKLSLPIVVWVVISMHLFTHVAIGDLLAKLAHGLRFIWPDLAYTFPVPSALTYRRYQLGVSPLAALFRRLCQPIATPDTPGAFLFGLRLMAIDGTVENLPDTPQNAAAFGRPGTDRGEGAFPQLMSVYLCECGTHTVVDANFWPCRTSERTGAARLLRSVGPKMLLMWDRGLHSYAMMARARRRGAHVLARLKSNICPQRFQTLADGSWLGWLWQVNEKGKRTGRRLKVRVIEYLLEERGRPGHGELHRLITTMVSAEKYPAREMVVAYHERWEIETTIDEQQTHQRLAQRPLRSQKPEGVKQEMDGLLIGHYLIRFLMHEAAVAGGIDSNPRVVKRKMSNFPLKREVHRRWPQPTRPFQEAVSVI